MGREVRRVLIVEDDDALREAIAREIASWPAEVIEAATARQAKERLHPSPDVLLLDVRLPDECAFSVLEEASRLRPAPVRIAMSGAASPVEAFRLARYGVRAYLAKPVSLDEITEAVRRACSESPVLEPLVVDCVGNIPMRELQRRVRKTMVRQALARCGGSRSGAARLLAVTRQAVQQILRRSVDDGAGSCPDRETRVLYREQHSGRHLPR